MPETAIDEHRDPGRAEDKVSAAAHPRKRHVDPVPQTSRMQQAPNGHLRASVPPSLASHPQ
jgi:hypothetical protein